MALKLIGEVALDGSGFERGLASMASSVKGFVATAFGFYGVEQAIRKTFETADELVTASQRLGVGVEQLQLLRQAAKESGAELGGVENAFEKINAARDKALSGSAAQMEAFKRLGISEAELRTQTAGNLFSGPLATAARKVSPEDLAGPLRDILGKGFGQMIPVLQTDFDELGAKMRKLGGIMDTETAVSLDILSDEFSLLANIIASRLGPVILQTAEGLFRIVGAASSYVEWFKSFIGGGTDKGGAIMAATPGFGGWSAGQKEAFDKAKAMPEETRAEAMDRAETAFAKEAEKWNGWLDEMKGAFAALAERLKHPPAPVFDTQDEAKAPKVKMGKDNSDSLTKVGNFLGSSRGVLESLAQQQVNYLRQITYNTARNPMGGTGDTEFPP